MPALRKSGDRLVLIWNDGEAYGPDGFKYIIQSEHVRGESRVYYPLNLSGIEDCPYGYTGSAADARAVCEWHAWVRAGRPVI